MLKVTCPSCGSETEVCLCEAKNPEKYGFRYDGHIMCPVCGLLGKHARGYDREEVIQKAKEDWEETEDDPFTKWKREVFRAITRKEQEKGA